VQTKERSLVPVERRLAIHEAELRSAIRQLQSVVRERLHLGRLAAPRRWRWLESGAAAGLLLGRRLGRRPHPTRRSDIMGYLNRLIRRVGDVDVEDLLCSVGLERRRGAASRIVSAAGMIGLGLVVGAGVGLLFAPLTGADMRRDIRQRARDLSDRGMDAIKRRTAASRNNGTRASSETPEIGREGTDF
jgi:hypothetical protein